MELCFLDRPSSSRSTAIEVATDVRTNTDSRNRKSDRLRVLLPQHIDLNQQQPDGGSSLGNSHEHAGGRSLYGQNLYTACGGPSWRRSESKRQRASAGGVSASGRARPLADPTCEPIRHGASIVQHPHCDARSNGSTQPEPFLPSVPVFLWGDAPVIYRKVPCDAGAAAHVELGFPPCSSRVVDRHVRPITFLPYVPSSRRNQPQRLASASSVAVATSTHDADIPDLNESAKELDRPLCAGSSEIERIGSADK